MVGEVTQVVGEITKVVGELTKVVGEITEVPDASVVTSPDRWGAAMAAIVAFGWRLGHGHDLG